MLDTCLSSIIHDLAFCRLTAHYLYRSIEAPLKENEN
jgi:hypothetical protein